MARLDGKKATKWPLILILLLVALAVAGYFWYENREAATTVDATTLHTRVDFNDFAVVTPAQLDQPQTYRMRALGPKTTTSGGQS